MTKKTAIKIGIIIVIIGMISFSDWSFAADGDSQALKETAEWINVIISILSWIWVWFAKGAGEFLTNKRVYGEILGLDAVLRKWWNIMKNMANYGLGFYFVYLIFRELLNNVFSLGGGKSGAKTIKDQILRILIAGIGIQASWFITAVVIDISTITMVAVGSLPAQIVSQDQKVEEHFAMSINDYLNLEVGDSKKKIGDIVNGYTYTLFPTSQSATKFLEEKDLPLAEPMTKEKLFDKIMPNADDVSGPLYYIGFAILNTPKLTSVNTSGEVSLKSTIFTTLLQGGTTIVFSIEMLVLFIFAVMRVAYLWMFVVLSPLVVLMWCIDKSMKIKGGSSGFWTQILENVNFTSFLWNAFKPTIIVLGFAFAIIFASLMKGVIISSAQSTINLGGVTTQSMEEQGNPSDSRGDKKYKSNIDGDVIGITIRHAGKTILEFLLAILTIVIVYYIIRFAMIMGGKDFVSKNIEKLQKGVGDVITNTPIIPVTTYDKDGKPKKGGLSLSGLASLPNQIINNKISEYKGKDSEAVDSFMKYVGLQDDKSFSETDKGQISTAGQNEKGLTILEKKRDAIKSISSETGKGLSLNPNSSDKFWQKQFTNWLTEMKDKTGDISGNNSTIWINMINWRNDDSNKDSRTLENMFKKNRSGERDSVRAYATLFNLGNITTWSELKDIDLSKKKEKNKDDEDKEGE